MTHSDGSVNIVRAWIVERKRERKREAEIEAEKARFTNIAFFKLTLVDS